jgi:putative ABC transport system permease protein
MGVKQVHPPKWASRFLEWYCRPDLIEEIQGDVYEMFYRKVSANENVAKVQFIWNVFRFFRLKNIKKQRTHRYQSNFSLSMYKSYLISGLRNITRNLTSSSINIVGLSIALACGVTIFLLIDSYYNRDKFHEKGDRLYLLMNKMKSADEVENWARSPYLLGPALRDEHNAIESVVRIQRDQLSVRHADIVFNQPVWFVDPEFLNVFSYHLLHGLPNALNDRNSIVLTEDMAIKYFGRTDVINEELSIKFPKEQKITFKISGVLKRIPDQSSMSINFLIPIQNWEDHVDPAPNIQWRTWAGSTFVLFRDGHQTSEINTVVDKYIKVQRDANDKFQIQSIEWIPIGQMGERSYDIAYALSWSNIPAAMIGLGVIAIALVLLACFNYMNVAVASVSTRLKEIGIRKVIGGGRKEIIQQFLVENTVLCALALGIGTILAATILLPGFNSLYPIHIPFEFSSSGSLFAFFGGVLLLVALISGAYPALYVSSFNPIKILRGKEKFGSKSLLSKSLLSFQFILSFTSIVACLVFVNSSDYFEKKDWGYDHDQHLYTAVKNIEQYNALKDLISQHKGVVSYAGSESHIGENIHSTNVNVGSEQVNVSRLEAGFNYLETMNVHLLQGRFFDEAISSDKKESAIVNEAFVRKMGWKDPLGQTFDFDNIKWYVIGVVKDFHYKEFYYEIDPMIIHIGPEESYKYVVVKAAGGSAVEVSDFIKKAWKSVAPDDPYEGAFQNEVFEQFFNSNRSNNKIMYFLSAVALVLVCMGLYGLVSYNLTRRLKEFSVRKIFGASLFQIFKLMNHDYLWIVLVAFTLGAPLGFYMMGLMIRSAYPEEIPIGPWPFVITILTMVLTVAFTIGTQLKRIAKENPTSTLRND